MSYLNEIKQNLELIRQRSGSLATAILALDALLEQHRDAMPAQLEHYLSQRSYDKALAWGDAALAAEGSAAQGQGGTSGTSPQNAPQGDKTNSPFTPPPGGCSGRRRS